MYISATLIVLIIALAISPDKIRSEIFMLMGRVLIFGIFIAIVLALIAAAWFTIDWAWYAFPEKHVAIILITVVAVAIFVAGLLGHDVMS